MSHDIIEIKPVGSYFDLDKDGYLINPTSLEKIQPEYQPVVDALVSEYRNAFGDDLHSVYLRGSVAKGQAIPGIADIDSFAFIKSDGTDEEKENQIRKNLREQFPEIEDFEIAADPLSSKDKWNILLNQSVLLWGESEEIPKLKPGKETIIHIPQFVKGQDGFKNFNKKLESNLESHQIRSGCVWFAKRVLRTGMELCMERSGKYSRDLYPCFETFAEYYPEKSDDMRHVLYLALNPTDNIEELKQLKDEWINWFVPGIKAQGLNKK